MHREGSHITCRAQWKATARLWTIVLLERAGLLSDLQKVTPKVCCKIGNGTCLASHIPGQWCNIWVTLPSPFYSVRCTILFGTRNDRKYWQGVNGILSYEVGNQLVRTVSNSVPMTMTPHFLQYEHRFSSTWKSLNFIVNGSLQLWGCSQNWIHFNWCLQCGQDLPAALASGFFSCCFFHSIILVILLVCTIGYCFLFSGARWSPSLCGSFIPGSWLPW